MLARVGVASLLLAVLATAGQGLAITPTPTRTATPVPIPRVILYLPGQAIATPFVVGCGQAIGDVNGDGKIDVTDGFYLFNFLFSGGPAPLYTHCATPNQVTITFAALTSPVDFVVSPQARPALPAIRFYPPPSPAPAPVAAPAKPAPRALTASRSAR